MKHCDWRAKAKACKHRRSARAAAHTNAGPGAAYTDRIGEIEILNILGCGSFGRVLKACIRRGPDTELVALKVIEGATKSPSDALRTLREIVLLRHCVRHPGIVHLKGVVQPGEGSAELTTPELSRVTLILEYCRTNLESVLRAKSLNERLAILGLDLRRSDAERLWGLATAVSLLRQLFGALRFLHSANVVHRDIKPSNVLLSVVDQSQGLGIIAGKCSTLPLRLKICDFGSARTVNEDEKYNARSKDHMCTDDQITDKRSSSGTPHAGAGTGLRSLSLPSLPPPPPRTHPLMRQLSTNVTTVAYQAPEMLFDTEFYRTYHTEGSARTPDVASKDCSITPDLLNEHRGGCLLGAVDVWAAAAISHELLQTLLPGVGAAEPLFSDLECALSRGARARALFSVLGTPCAAVCDELGVIHDVACTGHPDAGRARHPPAMRPSAAAAASLSRTVAHRFNGLVAKNFATALEPLRVADSCIDWPLSLGALLHGGLVMTPRDRLTAHGALLALNTPLEEPCPELTLAPAPLCLGLEHHAGGGCASMDVFKVTDGEEDHAYTHMRRKHSLCHLLWREVTSWKWK